MSKWMLKQCSVDLSKIAEKLGISNTVAQLLYVRGFKTEEQMQDFLFAEQVPPADSSLFYGIVEALEIISAAIKQHKHITVFGDYDADGIMSTVILSKMLAKLGAVFDYYIPDRENEGYGLNNSAIADLKQKGTELILACDNGISAIPQVEYANSLGICVVIIDHHDVQLADNGYKSYILPAAAAIINPKIPICNYPFKQYCAGGLCYRFAEALFKYMSADWQEDARDFLILAAIATVCDLVELSEDNRYIIKCALPVFKQSRLLGLNKLLKVCELLEKNITVYHIGYIIGPCINASGRLTIASLAAELFLTEDECKAEALAQELFDLNNTRKSVTTEGSELAIMHIEQNKELQNDKILVIYEPNIQSSVAGIIAGKIKERCHKPVIILAGDKDIVKGSCRSIEQYNIFEGLTGVKEYLENFGGHPMAAGLSIKAVNIAAFRKAINDACTLTEPDMQPTVHIDKALNIYNADLDMAFALRSLEPFGKGNEPPCFADKGIAVKKITFLGKTQSILRLQCVKGNSNRSVEMISFYLKDEFCKQVLAKYGRQTLDALLSGESIVLIDAVYSISVNEYNGRCNAQLTLLDFRMCE